MIPLFFIGVGLIAVGTRLATRREVFSESVDDVEALARVIVSEAGSGSAAEQTAVAWTVRNRAAKRHVSIARLVCNPCGRQGDRQASGEARPFASSRSATASARALARRVLAAKSTQDPTHGATAFIEPALQDKLNKMWSAGQTDRRFKPYKQVKAEWIARGEMPVGTVGRFEFFA